MNKKHVSKVGKYIAMACLLFVCAMAQSCRDEYFFDDTEPTFVGSSIYDYLDGAGDFTCFLRVINDLGYKDVLQRTGSKTLFVADDNAFMSGIEKEWGVKEYDQLTAAQKRIILYGAMLDNAYLLEMLSKMQSTGANAEPIPGQCLRRVTSAAVTDSIGLFSSEDLPRNNEEWINFSSISIRLALDASRSMMTHFIKDQLYMKSINEHDLQVLVGNPSARLSDIYVYDKKVIKEKSDVTCKNGYVHQLDGLLISPSNMAEELRKNGSMVALENRSDFRFDDLDSTTQIFSRLLDRFAVPVPIDENSEVAQNYERIYGISDKLFQKKYYTTSFTSYENDKKQLRKAAEGGTLLFDPGWNAYTAGTTDKEQDMAAIFAPSDRAFIEYFVELSGKNLLDRYAKEVLNKFEVIGINDGLLEAIDSVPINIIQPLVKNHMQFSFNSTVPSKFEYIVDDARDPMHVYEKDVMKVMLANNGVIYVMDTVYSPALYNSVIAPVRLTDTLSIFNKAIAHKDLQYDRYLLSMGNKFGLIITSDNGIVYYDPYTERKTIERKDADSLRGYEFVGSMAEGNLVLKVKKIPYDRGSYNAVANNYDQLEHKTIKPTSIEDKDVDALFQRIFKEILEYNIVIGDLNSEKDCAGNRQYYMSKGYGTVKVMRNKEYPYKVSHIAGGRELQNNTMLKVASTYEGMKNGQTFQIDGSIVQPPTQTVHDVLGRAEFEEFRNLCSPDKEVLKYFLKNEKGETKDKDIEKYMTFYDQVDQHRLVRFFDTYHYTVYVPSNDAMKQAYKDGLPTWESLAKEIEDFNKDNPNLDSNKNEDKEKLALFKESIKAGADLITKFVRYHFQDNSVYVDNVPHVLEVEGRASECVVTYETSAFNDERKKFCSVVVQSDDNTIAVCGDFQEALPSNLSVPISDLDSYFTRVCRIIKKDENKLYNVMTREVEYAGDGSIKTSSYAVVHQIDNFLVYGGEGGIYDAETNKFIR